jgi:hypothetical protein
MAERYIPEHRRTQFKAKSTFKPEELRRRREEQQVEIRKAKREENLAKRRGIGTGENRPGAALGAAPDSDDENPPTESQVCRLFQFGSTHMSSPAVASPHLWSCSCLVHPPHFVPRCLLWIVVMAGETRAASRHQLRDPSMIAPQRRCGNPSCPAVISRPECIC